MNYYTITSIIITALILTFGLALFSDYYRSDFPRNLEIGSYWVETEPLLMSSVYSITKPQCFSKGGYKDFVSGDKLNCNFNLTYLNNSSYFLNKITVEEEKIDGRKVVYDMGYLVQNRDYNFTIDLIKDGSSKYHIYFYFGGPGIEEGSKVFLTARLDANIITKTDYFAKQSTQIPLLFTLLSVGVFSVFIGIKYLRDLIENR